MKARDVSVGIQEVGGEFIVLVRFRLPTTTPLAREAACPDPPKCDPNKYGTRVKESSRRKKEKELQKALESIDLPSD